MKFYFNKRNLLFFITYRFIYKKKKNNYITSKISKLCIDTFKKTRMKVFIKNV